MPIKKSTPPGLPPGGGTAPRVGDPLRQPTDDDEAQPLEVMLDNMRWYFQRAENLTEKIRVFIRAKLRDNDTRNPRVGRLSPRASEYLRELRRLMETAEHFRNRGQAYAVRAAPYVHPKLGTESVKRPAEPPFVFQFGSQTQESEKRTEIQ